MLLGSIFGSCLGILLERAGVLVAVAQMLVNLFGSPVLVGVEVAVCAVAVIGVECLLAGHGVAHPEVAVGVHPGVFVEELQLLFGWRWGLVIVIVIVIVFWLASLQSFHLGQVGCVGARQGISSAGGTVDESVHQAACSAAQHAGKAVAEQYGCHRADGANNCGGVGIGVLAKPQGVALAAEPCGETVKVVHQFSPVFFAEESSTLIFHENFFNDEIDARPRALQVWNFTLFHEPGKRHRVCTDH